MKNYLRLSIIISLVLHAGIFLISIQMPEAEESIKHELAIEVEKIEDMDPVIEKPELQVKVSQQVQKEKSSIPLQKLDNPKIKGDETEANEDYEFNLFEDDDKFTNRTHTASTFSKENEDLFAPNSHIINYDTHDLHESLGDKDPIKVNTKKFSKTKQDTIFISFTGTEDFFKDPNYGGDDSQIRSIFAGKEYNPDEKVTQLCKILFVIKDGKLSNEPVKLSGVSELAIWVIGVLKDADDNRKLASISSGTYVLEYKNKLVDINQN